MCEKYVWLFNKRGVAGIVHDHFFIKPSIVLVLL